MPIAIFYDSQCPLCDKEMQHLRRADKHEILELVDLHEEGFERRFPQINKSRAMDVLHGLNIRGELVTGLDVTVMVWSAVGKHRWISVLRCPLIRPFADAAYLFFAKRRQSISAMFMVAPSCKQGQCDVPSNCARNTDEDAEF